MTLQQYKVCRIRLKVVACSTDSHFSHLAWINTPRREGGLVNLTTLLEPGLVLGQILQVNSSVQPEFNGQYKVQSIKHTGTISEAVNGRVTTQLALWKPTGNNQNFTIIK